MQEGFKSRSKNTSLGGRAMIRITKIAHGHAEAKVLSQSMDTNTNQQIGDNRPE